MMAIFRQLYQCIFAKRYSIIGRIFLYSAILAAVFAVSLAFSWPIYPIGVLIFAGAICAVELGVLAFKGISALFSKMTNAVSNAFDSGEDLDKKYDDINKKASSLKIRQIKSLTTLSDIKSKTSPIRQGCRNIIHEAKLIESQNKITEQLLDEMEASLSENRQEIASPCVGGEQTRADNRFHPSSYRP